jgi:hypothetical protein
MAETKKPKAGRLQKRREKQDAERERTSDTSQAVAELSKTKQQQYDEDRLRSLGERTGIFG